MKHDLTRRQAIATSAVAIGMAASRGAWAQDAGFAIATFSVDITPPFGHPLLGGLQAPATSIGDPLFAKGLIVYGADQPVVILGLDWCELRNDAYDRWRDALAKAAGTTRERAMIACLHQHDAPYADWRAQELLDAHGLRGAMFDPAFFEDAVTRVALAAAEAARSPQRITQIGVGEAAVERVACNRRVELSGQVSFSRYSFTRDLQVRDAPDGEIDPLVKTLSFWDGDTPRAAISCYAVHPMSYYGRGEVSADFIGIARSARQRQTPNLFQIYLSGCAGDVVAAKYNTGDLPGRIALAERLARGMEDAWKATKRMALERASFRNVPMALPPWDKPDLSMPHLTTVVANSQATRSERIHAAMGISWQERCSAGQDVDLPVLDLGSAQMALLPAEAFVGFQLAAQKLRPDTFVMTPAYGECAPGYFPTAKAREEGFVEEHGYCWVAPGADRVLFDALAQALKS